MSGRLVVVATPLGNMADLAPRAADVLASADAIACEDTRTTRKLLSLAGVSAPPLIAVHEHNEASMVAPVLERLRRGETVALATDAGMPGISDPGEELVRACVEAGVPVEVVPGPSAALTALVLSGFPTAQFVFEGFLPRKGGQRRQRLEAIAGERRTVVCFEAPSRVAATLADLTVVCGPERGVAIARELTKIHEDVWRGTLAGAVEHTKSSEPRGEHVLVIAPATAAPRN